MIADRVQRGRFPAGPFISIRCVVLTAAIIASFLSAAPVHAYGRRGYSYSYAAMRARQQQYINHAAAAQLNAAKQVLAVAESTGGGAQAKLAASLAKLREEAEKFHEAQSATRHAAKELAEIEKEILEEQKEDSPYAQTSKLVEAARQKLKDAERRILEEPGVQLQLSGLTGGKLAETKDSILSLRPEYLDARGRLDAEGGSLAHLRSELFQSDKHWKEAAESLTQARREEKAAEEMTHSGASGRVGLKLTARNASEAAAIARAAIAQAEAVLRANGGGRYLNSSTGSSGSRNSPSTYTK